MANFAKHLVSKKKRRFQENGFDLDLTFITKNVVAMGFPSEGTEGIYRNNMKDVKRYFDGHHKDHYKVYNLCSERGYDPLKFYGRVAKYPFDDHNAPPFVLMQPFCEDVHEYLQEDTRNIANGKGVTIPSQIRFVHYYGRVQREKLTYTPTTLIFKSIKLIGIPNFSKGTCQPWFTLKQGPEQVLIHKSKVYEGIAKGSGEALLTLDPSSPVCGDVKVEFFNGSGKDKMFNIWFNTFFIQGKKMIAHKLEIDKANKDKKHKVFPESFAVEFEFDTLEDIGGAVAGGGSAESSVAAQEAEAASGAGRAEGREGVATGGWGDDADLTTDDEDDEDDEWEGLPVSDL